MKTFIVAALFAVLPVMAQAERACATPADAALIHQNKWGQVAVEILNKNGQWVMWYNAANGFWAVSLTKMSTTCLIAWGTATEAPKLADLVLDEAL